MEKPRIRSVEAFPVEQQEQSFICLRDPLGYAPEPILIGMGAYFLITLFDGNHSRDDIRQAFTKRFGETLPGDNLDNLIKALDDGGFLDSPAFAARVARVEQDFFSRPERPAAHAGLCYELAPEKLRTEMARYFDSPGGPGRDSVAEHNGGPPAGLIAPHIDPRRGGNAYAHAYSELIGRDVPAIFVVLGTSHYGTGPELFSATTKNYATPLGTIETDRDFIGRLGKRYTDGNLFADELLHRNEHSIEFQALFLAYTLGTRGYKIVPILVSSFHEMIIGRMRPRENSRVAAFIAALGAELAAAGRRACIVAGVDFAHVGKKFGDQSGVDDSVVQWVRNEDLASIEAIKRGDPDEFYASIERDGDRRRICGFAPIYTQLELLRGRSGRLLKYDIAMEPQTDSAVSFASLAFD